MKYIVEKAGYEYHAAITAEQALTIVADVQPDMILMDLALSGDTDGLELTRRVKARYPETVVIAVTADHATYSMAAAFVNYIEKPFDVRGFIDIIQQHMPEREDFRF